jgi:uncharacterized protein (UPF0332 family)
MSESENANLAAAQKFAEHLLETFISPEVVRRQELGQLPRPLEIRAAQVIFFPDGKKPDVWVNEEIQAIAHIKLKEGVTKDAGEPIYESEIEGLEAITLTDNVDPDCGHVTFFRVNQSWILAFDFIYNKSLSRRHIKTAEEFINVAEYSYGKGYLPAFIDNLFSAAELLAKAVLLSFWLDPQFHDKAGHKAIHSRYNKFAQLGNVRALHAETFNKLAHLRYPARYLKRPVDIDKAAAETYLQNVKNMLNETKKLINMQVEKAKG